MRLSALALCFAQAPLASPAPPQAPAPAEAAPAAVAAYPGQLAAGRAELHALAEEPAALDDAARHSLLDLANAIEAAARAAGEPEVERAAALYDAGVARGFARDFEGAAQALFAARGLAGSSALGLDAAYDAGTFRLQRAEELRLEVPEVREKLKLPPPAQQPQPPSAGADAAADPIAAAREAYLQARAPLVDRLRADWRDEDTRANLELVARRLRELDRIERERQERERQQDQQDQQRQPGDESQESKPDRDQPPEGSDPPKPDEPPQDEPPEQAPEQESEPQAPEPSQAEPEERVLSKEEVLRLLDQLAEIEKQAEEVRAALRERRRTPVKRDW